jgi:hypothetical protein
MMMFLLVFMLLSVVQSETFDSFTSDEETQEEIQRELYESVEAFKKKYRVKGSDTLIAGSHSALEEFTSSLRAASSPSYLPEEWFIAGAFVGPSGTMMLPFVEYAPDWARCMAVAVAGDVVNRYFVEVRAEDARDILASVVTLVDDEDDATVVVQREPLLTREDRQSEKARLVSVGESAVSTRVARRISTLYGQQVGAGVCGRVMLLDPAGG